MTAVLAAFALVSSVVSNAGTAGRKEKWLVVDGVDAVPGVGLNTVKLGDFSSVEDCKDACTSNKACTMFTWNEHVAPHNCFGYTGSAPATWDAKVNSHCISGCNIKKVAHCGDSPRPSPSPPSPSPPMPPPPPPGLPRWAGTVPTTAANKSAGLRPVEAAEHITVYNATTTAGGENPFGLYNHGPMIVQFDGLFYMSWYNAPQDETTWKRSVYATSPDGKTWSTPAVLFTNFSLDGTQDGEENGPWTILGANSTHPGRLYTQSGTQDAGRHIEGIVSVMRRVGPTAADLGQPFILNRTVPALLKPLGWPTYLNMDPTTRGDAEQLLASFVRTTVVYPDDDAEKMLLKSGTMVYNERSLYRVPKSRTLVNLLRGGGAKALYAATCELPAVPTVETPTFSTCRPGVGDAFMNLPMELVADYNASSDPRLCEWTHPIQTNIPDVHSRTCASVLPSGAVYLVGNQIDGGNRDPVTLSISADGMTWDRHWAVRYGAPPVKYPGHAKCVGFQYPGGAVATAADGMLWLYVSYSIGKEDIALTRFPVSAVDHP